MTILASHSCKRNLMLNLQVSHSLLRCGYFPSSYCCSLFRLKGLCRPYGFVTLFLYLCRSLEFSVIRHSSPNRECNRHSTCRSAFAFRTSATPRNVVDSLFHASVFSFRANQNQYLHLQSHLNNSCSDHQV